MNDIEVRLVTLEAELKELHDLVHKLKLTGKGLEMVDFTDCERPFGIAKYTVTNLLWNQVMNCNEVAVNNLPKVNVSWNDTQEFIQKLNKITGKAYRLPTEHEWTLAATVDNTIYSGSDDLDEVGWYSGNCSSLQYVGQKKPNSLGIYDMSGNVWEWCWDWYNKDMKYRVLCGGSWVNIPQGCRCTSRGGNYPVDRTTSSGFRVVLPL